MAGIEIPGVDFNALAREAIAHQITRALVGADAAVNQIVVEALTRRVGTDGQISKYSSDNVVPYVQWIAEDLIRKSVKVAVQAKIEEMKPQIEAAVLRGLKAQSGTVAKMLTDGFVEQAGKSQYAISVTVDARSR